MYKSFNIAVLSFFFLILIIPLVGIFSKVNLEIYSLIKFLNNDYTKRIIFFSFYQAFLSSLISCLIAIPFSLALNRQKNNKIVKIIISLCGFSFVIPSILIVYAVIKIFGNNGFLNQYFNFYNLLSINSIYGLKAILIAHILLNTPFATRLFFQNLNNISKKYYEISNSLNLSYFGNIFRLEYPVIKQNIFTVFAVIFSLCFLSFAIVMALGGNPKNSTLEVAIYQYALFELNFTKAIILSFIQIIICLFFVFIGFYKLKGSNFFELENITNIHPHKNILSIKIIDFVLITLLSIFLFSPIITIFIDLINTNFSKIILSITFWYAFFNSLFISIFTGILVSIIGLIISIQLIVNHKNILFQQLLFFLCFIILIISPIIFSLGYFISLKNFIHLIWLKIIIVILINCIFLLPFSILILFNSLKNTFFTFQDIQKSFRIKIFDYFKIIFLLIKKNFLYIFSLSTIITFGDFTIISFFRNQKFETLPSYLYKLISMYKFEEASFVAGLILLISIIIYFVIDNFNYQGKPDIKT